MNLPSPTQFTQDADLTILMVLNLWLAPMEIYEEAIEWLHSLSLTLSAEDYRYVEQCFAQHINSI
jgi:hypothetical protein